MKINQKFKNQKQNKKKQNKPVKPNLASYLRCLDRLRKLYNQISTFFETKEY